MLKYTNVEPTNKQLIKIRNVDTILSSGLCQVLIKLIVDKIQDIQTTTAIIINFLVT